MKKRKLLIAAAIVALIIISFILVRRTFNKKEEGVIVLSGNVEVTEVNTGFNTTGRISGLFVEEGQKVNKGDKLAALDNEESESQLAQNKAWLSETLTKLEELRAGSRPQEIEQAKANVGFAEAELIKAKKDYDRSQSLYKNNVISARQMDSAQKTYDAAVAQHKKALEALSLVKEGPRKEVIKAASDRVRQAEASVSAYEKRLKDSVIYAPVSGIVLRKNAETGETIAAGIPVYTIGDLDNPWIRVYVKESMLGKVRHGQKAEVSTDSWPGKKYEGVVTYISSEAEFTPKNVQTQEERTKLVFGVKLSVKNTNYELKPGMPADVRILLK